MRMGMSGDLKKTERPDGIPKRKLPSGLVAHASRRRRRNCGRVSEWEPLGVYGRMHA